MEDFFSPWLFYVPAVIGALVWIIIVWLAWVLVKSVRGIHDELERIRHLVEESEFRLGNRGP
jgi:hypothetical protein